MAGRRVTPLSEMVDKQLYIVGLTRSDYAKKLKISYGYMSLILQGRVLPTVEMSNKMAKIAEINPREFRELAYESTEAEAS